MGHLSTYPAAPRRAVRPWPRARRRPWVRRNDPASTARLLAIIPSLPRPVLSRLTDSMIERMDELDGDPDVEPDGDERDVAYAEWHEQSGYRHRHCELGHFVVESEDDEDTHDREQEQAHD